MLRVKSLGSPIAEEDGLRVLAARFRGRGTPTDRYDVWMASLGPSEALLRRFLTPQNGTPPAMPAPTRQAPDLSKISYTRGNPD